MLNYLNWDQLTKKSIYSNWKSPDRVNNLNFLNDLLDCGHAKLIVGILKGQIKKIIPKCVETESSDFYQFGHIEAGLHKWPIRISSNLSFNSIQFPIEELQYFNKGKFYFFTCGDLFLFVDTLILQEKIEQQIIPHKKTKLRNYEIYISDLFTHKCIHYFGHFDPQTLDVDYYDILQNVQCNVKNEIISKAFYKYRLRGCMNGKKRIKVLLAKINMSDSKNCFEYGKYVTLKSALEPFIKYGGPKTPQGFGLRMKQHTDNFYSEKQICNHNNLLKMGSNYYIAIKYDKELDIEKVRQYCIKFLPQIKNEKTYSLRWAVMHAKFCKSTEEYQYWKKKFLEFNDKKDFYTETDIVFFKDCCSAPKFKYNKKKHYNYYG
jgi:hypothetical protein